jgi:hypothetical protein
VITPQILLAFVPDSTTSDIRKQVVNIAQITAVTIQVALRPNHIIAATHIQTTPKKMQVNKNLALIEKS